jgi:CheY-like chemotaxis protein
MAELRPILIVDDEPADVELTRGALSALNLLHPIEVVRDGAEALDYLYRVGAYASRPAVDPVVVLLDVRMPKLSGIEVLRSIKADPALRRLPVVMVTSSGETQDLNECYNLGVNAYVVKSVKSEAFMHTVKQVGIFWALVNNGPAPTTAQRR